jgi:predicted ArsR family transcriptional regulator
MQTRRQEILTILKQKGEATVDELAEKLDLTPVTVRHHLDILRADGLVEAPAVRRRRGPGRPQYVYTLTEAAADHFPQSYDSFTNDLLTEVKSQVGPEATKEIFANISQRRLQNAPKIDPDAPLGTRLDQLTEYLTELGYIASWEHKEDGWYIYASNCPYQNVSRQHPELCGVDQFLMEQLAGTKLISLQRISEGAHICIYQVSSDESA